MPTIPLTLAVLHTSDVDDAHVAVRQWLIPIIDVGVASSPPIPSPDMVKLHPAVEAPFISLTKLTTGALGTPCGSSREVRERPNKQLVRWETVKAELRRAAAHNAGHCHAQIVADSLAAAEHADHR